MGESGDEMGEEPMRVPVPKPVALFYTAGHTGVIYDKLHEQRHLRGHCNPITSCAVSADKRWIVTGDAGEESLLVVWDSRSGAPVRTYFAPHEHGIAALALSDDATRIVTLSAGAGSGSGGVQHYVQEVAVWEWTRELDDAVVRDVLAVSPGDVSHHVTFHPMDASQFATTGPDRVTFWGIVVEEEEEEEGGESGGGKGGEGEGEGEDGGSGKVRLEFFAPPLSKLGAGGSEGGKGIAALTGTAFVPGVGASCAVTATADGQVIVWDTPPSAQLRGAILERSALKTVRLIEEPDAPIPGSAEASGGGSGSGDGSTSSSSQPSPPPPPPPHAISWIGCLASHQLMSPPPKRVGEDDLPGGKGTGVGGEDGSVESLVVVGSVDGAVRVFDGELRLRGWYDNMDAGPITSVSFATPSQLPASSISSSVPPLPDFVVATSHSLVIAMEANCFAALEADARRGTLMLQGFEEGVYAVAADPRRGSSQFLTCSRDGGLQLWDADDRGLLLVRLLRDEAEDAELARVKERHLPLSAMRKFNPDEFAVTSASWHPSGAMIAVAVGGGVGQARGARVHLVDAETLGDIQEPLGGKLKDDGRSGGGEDTGGGGGGSGGVQRDGPSGAITSIGFSPCGTWLAAADDERYVTAWHFGRAMVRADQGRKEWEVSEGEAPRMVEEERWVYVGRARAHGRAVVGIDWCADRDGRPKLVSVGEDRRLVEYDISASSPASGLVVAMPRVTIDSLSTPSALAFAPATAVEGLAPPDIDPAKDTAQFVLYNKLSTSTTAISSSTAPSESPAVVLVATDGFKIRAWQPRYQHCLKTTLTPSFGGGIRKLALLPPPQSQLDEDSKEEGDGDSSSSSSSSSSPPPPPVAVFSSDSRVVGAMLLPLDGNPNRTAGVVGHAGMVTSIVPLSDGKRVLSAGGEDGTVALWHVDRDHLVEAAQAGGTDQRLFRDLLPGGADGTFYQELCDLFAYAQIRAQGEESTEPRVSGDEVPLTALPPLLRALGYYPTEFDSNALLDEVRECAKARKKEGIWAPEESASPTDSGGVSSSSSSSLADVKESVNLATVVQLFVNHKSAMGVGIEAIEEAVRVLAASRGKPGGRLTWRELLSELRKRGEPISKREFEKRLEALIGGGDAAPRPETIITGQKLAEEILGFVSDD